MVLPTLWKESFKNGVDFENVFDFIIIGLIASPLILFIFFPTLFNKKYLSFKEKIEKCLKL
jgi:hypothetical protein